ncbi:apyrase-like [Cloeon dipterum]|uniref:apyrase-like n=1 Tax=Cloeon dipterum TaxID=197152 RepID=UPI00321FC511
MRRAYKIGAAVVGVAVVIGIVLAVIFAIPDSKKPEEKEVVVTIFHFNDFHARFEPISSSGGPCPSGGDCFGGIARLVTAVGRRTLYKNSIVLNAGDNYQGSLLYTLFKYNITLPMMNKFHFDAATFGNHEFDDKVAGLYPFVDGFNAPLVAANMDASLEPDLDGKFKASEIIYRDGVKIGIVGCITKDTPAISSPEQVKFNDEIEAVKKEAAKLREQGVKIIILLSHSGYEEDKKIAAAVPSIDLIVGSHSHTFLYTGEPPSTDTPEGEYPTVIEHNNGRKTLIVQAYAYSKYLGFIQIKFDKSGDVASWEGNPILLDKGVPEDPATVAELRPWVEEASVVGSVPIGTSAVFLEQETCYDKECNLGNLLADAMVFEYAEIVNDDAWTDVAIALINPGGVRAPMGETSNLTFNDIVTVQPFQNMVNTIEMQGKDILELMELAATPPSYYKRVKSFEGNKGCFQVSGMKATYDFSKPEGSRVVDLKLKCSKCKVPVFEPVDLERWYKIAMPSFLTDGTEFAIIPERGRNKTVGRVDTDVTSSYIKSKSPISIGNEGRIKIIG